MKPLQTNLAVKFLAVILTIISGTACLLSGCCILCYMDSLFGVGYIDSGSFHTTLREYDEELTLYLEGIIEKELYNDSTYLQESYLEALESTLDPEKTNFRYVVREKETGAILLSNTGGQPINSLNGISFVNIDVCQIYDQSELLARTSESLAEQAYSSSDVSEEQASRTEAVLPQLSLPETVVIEYGVLYPLVYEDGFMEGQQSYIQGDPDWVAVFLVSATATLGLVIFLCLGAGHKKGVEQVCLGWQERIPYDLYLLVMLCPITAFFVLFCSVLTAGNPEELLGLLLLLGASVVALSLTAILSTAVRIKTHTLLRNTLTWWLYDKIRRALNGIVERGHYMLSRFFSELPMIWRFVILFLAYLTVNGLLALCFLDSGTPEFYLLGLLAINGTLMYLGCRWISQWRRIREGTKAIVCGDTTTQINTTRMFPDLREHAEALNGLGDSITRAVDERLKSEHFKAELITNVSHDLKTPLTSIINYVGLMKKEQIDNPTLQEYLEVLDRKSQRLKKLTEDLVEASKASTGNITVNFDCMNLSEFVQQAAAEYQERLEAQQLSLIQKLPENPVHINADGRHMWRILDNLLGNCAKYALEGTRIYLEVSEWENRATLCLKNISRDQLISDSTALTERFVRGDASRSTEGSGLGLSIARSLTEVQGGTFQITTDGDLFKVMVSFPIATKQTLPEPTLQLSFEKPASYSPNKNISF